MAHGPSRLGLPRAAGIVPVLSGGGGSFPTVPRPCNGDENLLCAIPPIDPERRTGGHGALQRAPRLRLKQGGDRAPPRESKALQPLDAGGGGGHRGGRPSPPSAELPLNIIGPAAEQEGSVAVQGVPEVVDPAVEAEPGGYIRGLSGRAPV